jgi:hypothetical protein
MVQLGMQKITKSKAIKLLGGSAKSASEAIGCTVQAIYKWPNILPSRIADRVIAAQIRRAQKRTTSTRRA